MIFNRFLSYYLLKSPLDNQVIAQPNQPFYYERLTWMSGIAMTCLASAAWSLIRQRPWTAAAITLGGVCTEVALTILMPSRSAEVQAKDVVKTLPSHVNPLPLSQKVTDAIEALERCYPISVIDPIQIRNRQQGGMMGQACGDAIGLFTEFTTKKQAQAMIDGKPLNFGSAYPKKFQQGYNWDHIKRFIKNGWTDDTDQALSLLRALYRKMKGKSGEKQASFALLFARELIKWRQYGMRSEDSFIGRQKPYCMGLGALVASVLEQDAFIKNPIKTAEKVWAKDPKTALQNRPAANGAIMRTAPIGLIFYQSLSDVVRYTIEACKVTHADPRCTASCVAFTVGIALSMRGYDRGAIFDAAEKSGLVVLQDELKQTARKKLLCPQERQDLDNLITQYSKEFQAHLHGDWKRLDLDEGYQEKGKINKIGYTFKCMGAAFYALHLAEQYQKEKKPHIFRRIIEEIAGEGGDADTNGAAAGALIGAFLGFKSRFPQNWTTHLADASVMEQAIQHTEKLSLLHKQMLAKHKAIGL